MTYLDSSDFQVLTHRKTQAAFVDVSVALLALGLGACALNAQTKAVTRVPKTATVQSATRASDSAKQAASKALQLAKLQAQVSLTMPRLIGLTESQARARLSALTRYVKLLFPPATTARDTSDSTLDGRVFDQSPREGAPITSRTLIRLDVYRFVPNQTVNVPPVVKLPLDQALRILAAVPLSWQVAQLTPLQRGAAIVVDQRPAGNSKARAGDTVYLAIQVLSTTTVPYLLGMDRSEVGRALKNARLTQREQQEEYSDIVPAGRVLRQHPDSGQPARIGSTVDVWFSLGKHPPEPLISTPDLTGRTLSEAARILDRLGLALRHVDSVPSRSAPGRVFDQKPGVRTPLHAGDPVDVRLALLSQRPRARVPWVVGMPQETAERVLIDSGFTPRVTSVTSPRARGESVVRQQPDSGILLAVKSPVDITVERPAAMPPASVEMPNVLRTDESEARDRLGFLSPRVSVVWHDVASREQHARVIEQDPQAGEPVVPGVEVTLTLGRFTPPVLVTVPNVVGRRLADATGRLSEAPLHWRSRDADLSNDARASVTAQDPPAGALVSAHDTVLLTLAPGAGAVTDLPPAPRAVVPLLRGRTLTAARLALDSAHLRLGPVIVNDAGPDSIVVRQRPLEGTNLDFDTPVELTLQERPSGGAETDGFSWWIWFLAGVGAAAFVVGGVLAIRRWLRDRRPSRSIARIGVEFKSPEVPPPKVDLDDESDIVAHHVALVSREVEVELDVEHSVLAHEEEINGRQ